jgi:hypothetical protein
LVVQVKESEAMLQLISKAMSFPVTA